MKRWILYGLLLLLLGALGFLPRIDLGKTEPVELLYLKKEGNRYCLTTDTDSGGYGETVLEAVADLKQRASGEIVLDTADYLVLDSECQTAMWDFGDILRPGVRLVLSRGNVDLKETARFLSVQKPRYSLGQCLSGKRIPRLWVEKEGLLLENRK